jgi:hypothetical protein
LIGHSEPADSDRLLPNRADNESAVAVGDVQVLVLVGDERRRARRDEPGSVEGALRFRQGSAVDAEALEALLNNPRVRTG